MLMFMQPQSLALSAAIGTSHSHANTPTANGASKRTAWYAAFADQATWSPIG